MSLPITAKDLADVLPVAASAEGNELMRSRPVVAVHDGPEEIGYRVVGVTFGAGGLVLTLGERA